MVKIQCFFFCYFDQLISLKWIDWVDFLVCWDKTILGLQWNSDRTKRQGTLFNVLLYRGLVRDNDQLYGICEKTSKIVMTGFELVMFSNALLGANSLNDYLMKFNRLEKKSTPIKWHLGWVVWALDLKSGVRMLNYLLDRSCFTIRAVSSFLK